MNSRERTLLAALIGATILIGGNYLFRTQYLDQIQKRQERILALQTSIEQHQVESSRIAAATSTLKSYATRSLPADPSTAVVLYQNWLIELSQDAGLEAAVVSPNQVAAESDVWNRIPFTIKAKANLDQVCDLLEDLEQASLLHKVTQLQLSAPESSSDPVLDVTIQIEALALTTAEPRSTILPSGATLLRADRTPGHEQNYSRIVAGNRFSRFAADESEEDDDDSEFDLIAPAAMAALQQRQNQATQPDPRQHVFLIASLSSNNQPMAWLYDRQRKEKIILQPGRAFSVGKTNGRVLSVFRDSVVYSTNGETRRLVMGKSLLQASPFRTTRPEPIRSTEPAAIN